MRRGIGDAAILPRLTQAVALPWKATSLGVCLKRNGGMNIAPDFKMSHRRRRR